MNAESTCLVVFVMRIPLLSELLCARRTECGTVVRVILEKLIVEARDHAVIQLFNLVCAAAVVALKVFAGGDDVNLPRKQFLQKIQLTSAHAVRSL